MKNVYYFHIFSKLVFVIVLEYEAWKTQHILNSKMQFQDNRIASNSNFMLKYKTFRDLIR